MKNKINFIAIIILIGILGMTACKKEETTKVEPSDKLLVADVSAGDYNVKMYAKDSLFVGYNNLYFKIRNTRTNEDVEQATLILNPKMDMGSMNHSSPFENPDGQAHDGYHEGAVVFIMPSSAGLWSLNVNIKESTSSTAQNVTLFPTIFRYIDVS